MGNNILLNWRFWVTFYFFLCYCWCFLDTVKFITRFLLDRIFCINPEWFEKILGRRNLFMLLAPIDTLVHILCIVAFVGALQVMLTNEGVKTFTLEHLICSFLAFLFAVAFYHLLAVDLQDPEPKFFKVLIPASILFSFCSVYIFAFKFPLLLTLFTYLGSFVYKYFLISWFPWVVIGIATFLGGTTTCLKILLFLPLNLIGVLLAPFKIIYNLLIFNKLVNKHGMTIDPNYKRGEGLQEVPTLEALVARKCLNDSQTYEVTKYPTYSIGEIDVNLARKNPDTFFARGLVENPNFKISGAEVEVAKQNPTSKLAVALNDRVNKVVENIKDSFDTRWLFSGKLLTKDTCICALCWKTKNVGAKLSPRPGELDRRTLIVCVDCQVEQMALRHNISKGEASVLHNFISNEALEPFIDELIKGYFKVTKKSDFDTEEEKQKLIESGILMLSLILEDEKIKGALGKLDKEELRKKFHELFSDPLAFTPSVRGKVSRPKIGRNAPCPCGSGKKYKKCCLVLK